MATKAFQKIYTKISQITKATCSLKATGVGYDELAMVNGKLAQVLRLLEMMSLCRCLKVPKVFLPMQKWYSWENRLH